MDSVVCSKFLLDPTSNPRTGRKISKHGKTFADLSKECSRSSPETDTTGYRIFSVVDNKFRLGNKIFETERLKIHSFYENKQVTLQGFRTLVSIIDLYERAYIRFIDNVVTKRIFVEKSSSGKPPRNIISPQDWGEAIIELYSLVDSFKIDLATGISVVTSKDYISKECLSTKIEDCNSPCIKKKPLLKSAFCDY